MEPKLVRVLESLFYKIDKDKNGIIDVKEFEKLTKLVGIFTPQETKALFNLMDLNLDGKIELKEFICGLEKMNKV